jgi:hypothetical protein
MPQERKDEIVRKKIQFRKLKKALEKARYQKYKEWKDGNV